MLDAHAVLRRERADRERGLEALAVAVLTVLGERDGAVRGTERRAGDALQTMTAEEGLVAAAGGRVVRQWRPYGAGGVSATPTRGRPAERQRPMSARHMHRLAIRTAIVGHPGRRCGPGALYSAGRPWEDDAFHRPGDAHGMIRATQRHEIRAGHYSPGLR